MIYAVRAVGTEFIKFGRANNLARRLKELETGCPYELDVLAVADWPDGQESAIHSYLSETRVKLEWFMDSARAQEVIGFLNDKEHGLTAFQALFVSTAREGTWRYIYKRSENQHLNDGCELTGPAKRKAEREAWWRANGKSIHQG
jgi:hypothetical protein